MLNRTLLFLRPIILLYFLYFALYVVSQCFLLPQNLFGLDFHKSGRGPAIGKREVGQTLLFSWTAGSFYFDKGVCVCSVADLIWRGVK